MSTETLRSLFYRIPTAEIGNTGIRILFCFFIFLFCFTKTLSLYLKNIFFLFVKRPVGTAHDSGHH